MAVSVLQVMGYTAAPVAATVLGGAVATVRTPGPRLRSGIQHFAAGVVFAAVALELLPAVVREHATGAAVVGFAAGIATLLAVRRLTAELVPVGEVAKEMAVQGERPLTSFLVAVGVDLLIDGILVGIGFAAGEQQGVLLTIALSLEVLFVGLAVATTLAQGGQPRGRVVATTAALAVTIAIGAFGGTVALGGATGTVLEVVLAFGSAALLFLVTEELLVEAHEVPETMVTTAMFFGGFLLLLVIDMAAAPARG